MVRGDLLLPARCVCFLPFGLVDCDGMLVIAGKLIILDDV